MRVTDGPFTPLHFISLQTFVPPTHTDTCLAFTGSYIFPSKASADNAAPEVLHVVRKTGSETELWKVPALPGKH